MMAFTLLATTITVLALALLVMPLMRTRNTVSYERHAQNIHYAKERLQELEEQLKNASISATAYESLKLEIETTLADDIDLATQTGEAESVMPRNSNKFTIGAVCLCVPVMALALYLITGTPEALNPERAEQRPNAEQIEQLVKGIEDKLAENPNSLEGWSLLSKTYLSLGRYADARVGYLRVIQLGGETATNYTALADATALVADGEITPETMGYLDKALTLNPTNQQALWLAGLGAAQKGENAKAKGYWEKLVSQLDSSPKQQRELREIMAENLGESSAPLVNSVSLSVSIELAADVAGLAAPSDTVFVFARAQSGPPAPLAVKRLTVADLPAVVELSDNDAMVEQFMLSKFEDVTVIARISKSGQPIAQSGDIQSEPVNVKNNHKERVLLSISSPVE